MAVTTEQHHLRFLSGFKAYVIRNESVEVSVVPQLGARIVSLKDLRTGREWMWHPGDTLKLFSNDPGDDFACGTLAGADECLPTIAPCSWNGRSLPDHGEVWSRPWAVDEDAWTAGGIRTSIKLPVSPLQFERSVELCGNEIRLSYVLTNLGSMEEHYLWALHPLLRLQAEDRLVMPAVTRAMLDGESWLEAVANAIPAQGCSKLFAGPLTEGRAMIENLSTGDRFALEWSPSVNSMLGLWLTRGGWHGHHHFAMEPTNGAPDSLAAAASTGCCGRIKPGEVKPWAISIRIGTT